MSIPVAAPGHFLTFEGMDGCGKTTQLRMLAQFLREQGRKVVETVEPGGTEIGRQIRRILLDPASSAIQARTELLLYFASRAQNVDEVIRPALDAGSVVLCDRFTDSTLVYQGCGRGLAADIVIDLDRIATTAELFAGDQRGARARHAEDEDRLRALVAGVPAEPREQLRREAGDEPVHEARVFVGVIGLPAAHALLPGQGTTSVSVGIEPGGGRPVLTPAPRAA